MAPEKPLIEVDPEQLTSSEWAEILWGVLRRGSPYTLPPLLVVIRADRHLSIRAQPTFAAETPARAVSIRIGPVPAAALTPDVALCKPQEDHPWISRITRIKTNRIREIRVIRG